MDIYQDSKIKLGLNCKAKDKNIKIKSHPTARRIYLIKPDNLSILFKNLIALLLLDNRMLAKVLKKPIKIKVIVTTVPIISDSDEVYENKLNFEKHARRVIIMEQARG
jgi:hypothetical protein